MAIGEDERKMEDAKVTGNGKEYSVVDGVESDDEETHDIVDVKVDDGDQDDEEDESGDDEEDEEDSDDNFGEEDEDEDSEEDSEEEDLGTEYLVQPVGRAEDEEDASDFEPNNESEEDEDDEEENDDGKVEGVKVSSKRRRPSTDDSVGNIEDDDERPLKR